MTTTAELKVYLPNDLDTRFRKAAMSAFGYGRGSLSKAAAEALVRWCSEREGAKSSEAIDVHKNETPSVGETVEAVKGGLAAQENAGASTSPAF